ncbi:hypothetical protein BATR1942_16925 [Bacillus atrophaeus 1942]|uniref:Uncharacterized protein n=1 Tax=Bacillus atrophaeus (strain 1942) TaxID=720555 RepID=A0ABM5M2F7_BACA1|nr:hypothetical protein BATR1942_16925 [Bacillus atrophaeus 1942]
MFITGNEKTEHKEIMANSFAPSPFRDIGMKKAFHSMSPAFCVGNVHCSSTSYDWYLKKLLTKTLSYFMMKAHSETKSSGIVTGKAGKT